jgi:hypothetical protein
MSAAKVRYGCGANVTIAVPELGSRGVPCGSIYHGEYIQCPTCYENNPAPALPDDYEDNDQ